MRLAPIVAGLLAGILVAIVLIGAIVALVPDEVAATEPPATIPPPSASAAPSVTAAPASPGRSAPTAGESPGSTAGAIVTGFHIGEPAPPLRVPQVGGGTVDLAALRGKPVWVDFMATWCPQCQDDVPAMNSFAVRYADAGLVVVAVDVGEPEDVVAAFANSLNATFPVGLDVDGAAQDAWQAYALPMHFWVDAEGIIRDGGLGGLPRDLMAQALGRILPDVEVTP